MPYRNSKLTHLLQDTVREGDDFSCCFQETLHPTWTPNVRRRIAFFSIAVGPYVNLLLGWSLRNPEALACLARTPRESSPVELITTNVQPTPSAPGCLKHQVLRSDREGDGQESNGTQKYGCCGIFLGVLRLRLVDWRLGFGSGPRSGLQYLRAFLLKTV